MYDQFAPKTKSWWTRACLTGWYFFFKYRRTCRRGKIGPTILIRSKPLWMMLPILSIRGSIGHGGRVRVSVMGSGRVPSKRPLIFGRLYLVLVAAICSPDLLPISNQIFIIWTGSFSRAWRGSFWYQQRTWSHSTVHLSFGRKWFVWYL